MLAMQGGLHYQETPLFALQGAVNYFYLLCAEGSAIAGAVRAKSRQERLEYGLYSVYLVVPCVTFFVDDQAVDSLQLSLTIFLALLILYLTIYVDRENELLRQREQLTQSRVAVMTSTNSAPCAMETALRTSASVISPWPRSP